ncbi:PH domain-containing protein [Spirosoma daeguense]
MTKIYPSKIGPELVVTLSIALGGPLLLMIYGKNWPGIVIVSLSILFVSHLIMTTNYRIQGNRLTIKSGFLFNKTVDIITIKKVVATQNIISAPATSLDRLEVIYNRFDSVIISPKDKDDFVKELLAIKTDIEVSI